MIFVYSSQVQVINESWYISKVDIVRVWIQVRDASLFERINGTVIRLVKDVKKYLPQCNQRARRREIDLISLSIVKRFACNDMSSNIKMSSKIMKILTNDSNK